MLTNSITTELPLAFFNFRVLIWKDGEVFVGQCLETGSIATANGFHELRNLIYSTLVQEHDFNVYGEGNLRNLLDTPAPIQIWRNYRELIQNRNADFISGVTMLDATY